MTSSSRQAFAALLLLSACVVSTEHPFGPPPVQPTFKAGNPGEIGPYGSGACSGAECGQTGSTGPTGEEKPPECPQELKRCAHTFTYPYNGEQSVELRGSFAPGAWDSGVLLARAGNVWTVSVELPFETDVTYQFFVDGKDWKLDPNNPKTWTDGTYTNSLLSALTCDPVVCAEPTVTDGVFDWRDSVIYFVFVDRFFDGDASNNCNVAGTDAAGNYQGGDWKGVTQKINTNYFGDMGVNTLWITVPVKNTTAAGKGMGSDSHNYSGYHGYWPSNVEQAESCFGTKQDLVDMVDAAHAKGIKILFDYAMVHMHIDSPVYAQHPDWFWPKKKDGMDCICGPCDWNTEGHRCWFTDYLPHWNFTNPAARDYSVNNVIQWIKDTGIDGLRLDAIKHVDNSWLLQLRQRVTSEIIATQSPQQRFYMVGETYDFGNRDFLRSFVDPKTKLDGQFDFPLRLKLLQSVVMRQGGDMTSLATFMDDNDKFYGPTAVMSTWIGNHDLGRVIHQAEDSPMWDEYSDGKDRSWVNQPQLPNYRAPYERLANAFAVLLTNKGAPLIYYGDEVGLAGAGDPDNRRMMQFGSLNADQQFLLERIKLLGKTRADHPAMRRGTRTTVAVNANVWVYKLVAGTDTVYVAVNRSDSAQNATGLPSGTLQELITSTSVSGSTQSIPARQTRIYTAP